MINLWPQNSVCFFNSKTNSSKSPLFYHILLDSYRIWINLTYLFFFIVFPSDRIIIKPFSIIYLILTFIHSLTFSTQSVDMSFIHSLSHSLFVLVWSGLVWYNFIPVLITPSFSSLTFLTANMYVCMYDMYVN